jgi:hypothetical protein
VRSSASIGAYSGDEPRKTSGLLRGEDEIPFGANPVRDLSLNGANTGFKTLCEPSHWKVKDLLTGFTALLNLFYFPCCIVIN